MNQFERKMQELEEGFSQSTVMNVDELRLLYHGRINIYTSFTDDGEFSISPVGNEIRPAGIVCHAINDVVGRKVKSKEFYANVFRINRSRSSRKFVDDIRQYDSRNLQDDLQELEYLDYLSIDEIVEAVDKATRSVKVRSKFQRFWEVTKFLAQNKGRQWPQYWRRILMDVGYNGFNDPSGTGILVKGRTPVCIQLDTEVEHFDIVPIQKFRRDPRRRVATQVNREVKRMETKRNRIAKRQFTDRESRKDDTNYAALWGKVLGGL